MIIQLKKIHKLLLIGLLILLGISQTQTSQALEKQITKDDVGLNVHWALGGFNYDDPYEIRLWESQTEWAREHFYTEVFLSEDPGAWYARYDEIMARYKRNNIKVVGMLAYGPEHGDFYPPDLEIWESFISDIVTRYQNDVVAWEIWNEPDSPDFLVVNNPETYEPLLTTAYTKIKEINPDAIVLTGGLSWPNRFWAERLYQDVGDYFDAIAVHGYYCRDFKADGDFRKLEFDLKKLKDVIDRNRPGDKVWVTEFGCSTGSAGISEDFQKEYFEAAMPVLFKSGIIQRVFIYNLRNRDINDVYEDNFGLLDLNLEPRPAWNWYDAIYLGPYNQRHLPLAEEQALAQELRTSLEYYFGQGAIPVSAERWPTFVNAYVYGGYPVQDIVQAIRFGGKTVSPTMHHDVLNQTPEYSEYINKNWTGRPLIFAYGKTRSLLNIEQQKARELKEILQRDYDLSRLRIDPNNWGKLVNAYVYGGYPAPAIARAVIYGGKTVHPEISYEVWRTTRDYQDYINKPI